MRDEHLCQRCGNTFLLSEGEGVVNAHSDQHTPQLSLCWECMTEEHPQFVFDVIAMGGVLNAAIH